MPEGDTVYLTARRLHAALAGHPLVSADLRHPELSTVDLTGIVVDAVASVGKHLFVRFADGRSLHNHLKMDGSWHLYRDGQRWQRPGHQARVLLGVAGRLAVGFRLHDLALVAIADEVRFTGHLGPDLLAPEWTATAEVLRRMRARTDDGLAAALLDQRVVAGIGNVYATELCFLARRNPHTPVSQVDDDTLAAVIDTARKLLWRNKDRPARNITGNPARGHEHWVYSRAGRPCRRCGSTIEPTTVGDGVYARPGWFCPSCQPG